MVSRLVIVAIAVVIIITVGGGLYYSQTPISPVTTPEIKPTTPEVKQETTPEAAKETPTPEAKKETPTAVIDGESLYKKNCLDCHGAKGVGDTASALSASNANRSILENGDVEHPSFKDILTSEEITAIIDYLKS